MPRLVRGPQPIEIEALIENRRRLGPFDPLAHNAGLEPVIGDANFGSPDPTRVSTVPGRPEPG